MPESSSLATPARLMAVTLAACLLAAGISRRTAPPAPRGDHAPATMFSAVRAEGVLRRLLREEVAHPIGSDANRVVRARIEQELRAIGLEPQLQAETVVSPFFGVVARPENVIARIPGREEGPATLLACHYDSVPAGPGVSDDGVGVAAVLETLRALQAGPPPRWPVIALIDDGEESGLLGARSFTRHALFAEVAAVVNLEARGTSGPSLLFQTSGGGLAAGSPDEAQLLPLLRHDPSPVFSTSLYTTVYELLPNDTDMSVFIGEERSGFNFAFIGDLPRYHTPRDDLAHFDAGSLQHHGDHALSLVRALSRGDWQETPARGKQVYLDLLGTTIVSWPRRLALIHATLAALLLVFVLALLVRQGALTGRQLLWGGLAVALVIPLAGIAGPAVAWLLRLRDPSPWVAHPGPALLAFRALALALGSLPLMLLAKRATAWGLWGATWFSVSLVGLVSCQLPGLSYLFVVPVAVAASSALPAAWRGRADRPLWALPGWVLPLVAAFGVWVPLSIGLVWVALFVEVTAAVSAGLLLLPLSPFLALPGRSRWGFPALALAVAITATLVSLALPTHTPDLPQALNLSYHEDADELSARWLVGVSRGPVPAELEAALPELGAHVEAPFPWGTSRYDARIAPTSRLGLPLPELEVVDETPRGSRRLVRVRIRSARGARTLRILLGPGANPGPLWIDGHHVPNNAPIVQRYIRGWSHYAYLGAPRDWLEVVLDLPNRPVNLVLLDQSEGLPPAGQPLLDARPEHVVPIQEGDTTLVTRSFWL